MHEKAVRSPSEIEALADQIADLAAHIDAAIHELLTRIRLFDQVGGWHAQGALSCAHWLSWRVGLGLGPAREKVRVAHRLAELPLIDEALRRGELSYSKVRAMTRVATAENEAEFLVIARNTTASQLEKICRLRRQVISLDEPRAQRDDRRYVMSRPTDDGMVSIQLRLHPDEAAHVLTAFESCAGAGSLADGAVAAADMVLSGATELARPDADAGTVNTADAGTVNTADAGTAKKAERNMDGYAKGHGERHGQTEPAESGGKSPGTLVRPPVEVVIHVSAETLQ